MKSSLPPPDSAPSPHAGGTRTSWRRTVGIVATVAVPVITAAAILTPLVANWGATESSPQTLRVSAPAEADSEPEVHDVIGAVSTEGDGGWSLYVPMSTDFSTFPEHAASDPQSDCQDPGLRAWGDAQGGVFATQEFTGIRLSLSNDATTGGSLSLTDVRFEGHPLQMGPYLRVQCASGAMGGGSQVVLLDMEGSQALYSDYATVYNQEPMTPGTPYTINLAPGEVSQIAFERSRTTGGSDRYSGRIVATEASTSLEIVLAEDVLVDPLPIEGYQVEWNAREGRLTCSRPERYIPPVDGSLTGSWKMRTSLCSVAEAQQLLAEAGEAAHDDA